MYYVVLTEVAKQDADKGEHTGVKMDTQQSLTEKEQVC